MVQKKTFLNIYVSAYPFECGIQNISFAPRAEEIKACTNENVRRQKLYVWKLLELAVGDLPGMDLNSLNLRKDENFVQDEHWYEMSQRYDEFLNKI